MWRRKRQAALAGVVALAIFSIGAHAQTDNNDGTAPAQAPQGNGRGGPFAGMARTMGEVTAVSGSTLTLKTEQGAVQVVTTDNTRVMKDRAPVKVSDLHPGDGLMAVGLMDAPSKTLHAAMIFAQDAAEIKAMRDNLGKTYITGRVTAVDLDNAKATVERADHVAQTIGFDDSTSFKRAVRGGGERPAGGNGAPQGSAHTGENPAPGRGPGGSGFGGGMGMGGMALSAGFDRAFTSGESITLADIKVGDMISGTGAVKNGVFVPGRVLDSPPRQHHPREPGTGASGSSTTTEATPSSTGPGAR